MTRRIRHQHLVFIIHHFTAAVRTDDVSESCSIWFTSPYFSYCAIATSKRISALKRHSIVCFYGSLIELMFNLD